ncbi:MAG TPA: ATP-binding protein, partial [Tissierellaceae bacterium]|nr:ATP-binding protein [Tissierellaceae bacterium]
LVKGCICIFRDTTEIEELQKQIAMAEKLAALGRITSGITHEIRNPLLPIRNASQHLLENYQDQADGQMVKLLKIIQEESERLNRFLQQLVSLNRDTFFATGECDLLQVLEETLLLLNYGIVKNDIKLELDIGPKDIRIPLNEDNLKQIFLNLILNAIDAIVLKEKEKDRKICIKVEKEMDYSIVEINDTGIGMTKDELAKAFDPFYTTKDDGTGIGLPIIHNIVTSSGGKISMESKLDKGTQVTLLLPIA